LYPSRPVVDEGVLMHLMLLRVGVSDAREWIAGRLPGHPRAR
jgi:hypothetical protein